MEAGRARAEEEEDRERERGGRGRRGHARTIISDDIRETLVDHVINHGLTMREAGQRLHPNLSCFTVSSIIRTFRLENRMARRPTGSGRQRLFTQQQELAIVNLVRANNAIRLHQLQQQILADRQVFNNINQVSITTIRRILVKHNMTIKQLYRVPFERNGVRVKELRHEYVQVKEFFSAWRWRVYDRQPHARMPLLQAMEQACRDIEVRSVQGWIRHTRGYFPRCLAREDIACDVDEILWPDPNRRQDP
ncbi:uncharacterized protein LOC144458964 [Epinephelus lanceolatus]